MLLKLLPIWIAYFLAAASPGPAQIFVIESSTLGSRVRGRWAALGVTLGTGFWVLLVALGLNHFVQSVSWGRTALRWGSAALLAYFFVRSLILIWQHKRKTIQQKSPLRNEPRWATFSKGFLMNLLNPSAVVFFLSLFAPLILQAQSSRELWVCAAGVMLLSTICYQCVAELAALPRMRSTLLRFENHLRILFAAVYLYFLLKTLL
jgi:threonine efflux protein